MFLRNRALKPPVDPLLVEPFWHSEVMRGESLFFVDSGAGPATATLLFDHPERFTLTSATGELTYEQGRDYTIDSPSGVVNRTEGSRIPFATLAELYFPDEPLVLIGDGADFHYRQVAATYAHRRGDWRGYVPRPAAIELPR